MARKIQLKTVNLSGGVGNGAAPSMFSYASCMLEMLRIDRGQGLTFEQVCRSVECIAPIERAIEAGEEEVTLTDQQWQTLQDRLQRFPFGLADQAIVDFGRMILDAPELGA